MLQIEVTLNVFFIAALVVFSFLLGFRFANRKMHSRDKRIVELEKEMLSSHAEILQLQREKVDLMHKIQETPTRVISITNKEISEKSNDLPASNKAAGQ